MCILCVYIPGEEIADTAKREVREETGIDAEFIGVIAFRHQQKYRYGCGDFYFICLMRPSKTDQQINKCDQEIAACKWIDVRFYSSLKFVKVLKSPFHSQLINCLKQIF